MQRALAGRGHANHELSRGRQIITRHHSILNEINTSVFSHVHRQVRTLNRQTLESLLKNHMMSAETLDLALPSQTHPARAEQVSIIRDEVFGQHMRCSTMRPRPEAPNLLGRVVLHTRNNVVTTDL